MHPNWKHKSPFFYVLLLSLTLAIVTFRASARDITFCGERVPIDQGFVATKLMNVIRQQLHYANLPSLRRDAKKWFPYIEYCLRIAGMPTDLKYIPIVESGFRNATSMAGAQGFWQFTEETALGYGLQVNGRIDERNDPYKSTIAALLKLANDYKEIRRRYNVASWALAAAAYNCGAGCVYKKLKTEGGNYFTMTLNAETAVYVYKIIAIKELFEYPEIYMKYFQYNVFAKVPTLETTGLSKTDPDLQNIDVNIRKDEAVAPEETTIESVPEPTDADLKLHADESLTIGATLIGAQIVGKYPHFADGDSVTIRLQEDLETLGEFNSKGSLLTGKGWLIDDRVYVDLGFRSTSVILYGLDSKQGVGLTALKNKTPVILRIQSADH